MLLSTIILAKPYKDYTEFDVLPVLVHREDVSYKLLEIPSVNALIHYNISYGLYSSNECQNLLLR